MKKEILNKAIKPESNKSVEPKQTKFIKDYGFYRKGSEVPSAMKQKMVKLGVAK